MSGLELLVPKAATPGSSWLWATVTQASPLRVRFDGDTAALDITPDTLVAGLNVADRVWVGLVARRITVVGRAGGLTSVLSDIAANAAAVALLPARNLVRNGRCRFNQRVVASGVSLASGAYGFDGWKATAASTVLTWTAAPQGQAVTISSGKSVAQIVPRAEVRAGTVVASIKAGCTAKGRIYNVGATPPAFAAFPFTATPDGAADVTLELYADGGAATFDEVQVEYGTTPTPFERVSFAAELDRLEMFYQKSYALATAPGSSTTVGAMATSGGATTTGYLYAGLLFRRRMRAAPTVTFYDNPGTAGKVSRANIGVATYNNNTVATEDPSETGIRFYSASGSAAHLLTFHYVADAEL